MSKTINISDILTDLENGVTRPELATKYDITPREIIALFKHDKLKGKKAKKIFKTSFEIIDDTVDTKVDEPQVTDASLKNESEKTDERSDKVEKWA